MATKIFRPVFCFPQHLMRASLFLLLFLIAPLFIGMALLEKHTSCTPLEAFAFSFLGIISLALFLSCVLTWIIRAFYKTVEFRIFATRVEYSRDFFTVELKDLKFKNVKEMTLTQGPLQRIYGLGTILLQSHASPQQVKGGTSGLKIYNVENPKELYAFLKKKVDEADT